MQILTKTLIRACASDAYRRVMRSSQNHAAAREAYRCAFFRLFDLIDGPEGWADLPEK